MVLYVVRTYARIARHRIKRTMKIADMMMTQPPWCVASDSSAGLEDAEDIVTVVLLESTEMI